MPRKIPEETKAACIRLRQKGRKSINEIRAATGVSKGTLSILLAPYPLTKKEIQKKIQTGQKQAAGARASSRAEPSTLYRMWEARQATPSQKGKIAEAAALLRLVVRGFCVFHSIFDGDCTDMLVEVPSTGKVLRVQVKWARKGKHGAPGVSLRRMRGHSRHVRYRKEEFDVLVAYDLYSDTACVWGAGELTNRKAWVSMSAAHAESWHKLLTL